MGSNKFSQIEEFQLKEALFGNVVKSVWNPSTLLGKGPGRLCLINQGLFIGGAVKFYLQKVKNAYGRIGMFSINISLDIFIHTHEN